ncbi:MAG TPA: class I SAM-dependent methyltransferase [Deltaproteobacteria bacterium]|nr:class I SAM-dependent methyltransferase [Deltaproteobacteria bacterium]
MKTVRCYYCGSGNSSFYAAENGFQLVKCDGCGLLFVKDRPDDDQISQAHRQGRHAGEKELDVTGRYSPGRVRTYRKVLQDLYGGDMGHIRTWLDVGCGHGEFMLAVQRYASGNIEVTGTEPNVHKQASARARGLNVGYFDLETHGVHYDAISLLNVYSHLPDPPRFLENLIKLLNPGGELIVQTGDTADFSASEHYRPFSLPDHLSFASQAIVVGILERLGFQVIHIRKYPYVRLELGSMLKETVKALLPHFSSRLRYYLNWKKYSEADMFIRARLRN